VFVPACQCSAEGSRYTSCDQVTGQCVCLPDVVGLRCDSCAHGAYGFPNCRGKNNTHTCRLNTGKLSWPLNIVEVRCDGCSYCDLQLITHTRKHTHLCRKEHEWDHTHVCRAELLCWKHKQWGRMRKSSCGFWLVSVHTLDRWFPPLLALALCWHRFPEVWSRGNSSQTQDKNVMTLDTWLGLQQRLIRTGAFDQGNGLFGVLHYSGRRRISQFQASTC